MKMDVRAMAITTGLFWGGSVLLMEALNLVAPKYGSGFLKMIGSVYPGYKGSRSAKQVALGAGYAVLDGAMSGLLFALIYNQVAKTRDPNEEMERAFLRAAS